MMLVLGLVLGLVVPHTPRGGIQAQAMVDGAIVRRRSRGWRRRDGASSGMLPWLLRRTPFMLGRIAVHGGSEREQRRESLKRAWAWLDEE